MGARPRQVDLGAERGRRLVADVAREIRLARLDRGLSQADVAQAIGVSQPSISRLERGMDARLSFVDAARAAAVVGLELSVRAFPAGRPVRDAAHANLLVRLRSQLHRSLVFRVEVPLPLDGDLRAWDAVVSGRGWRLGVEAETRPQDLQALLRRLSLKQRDSNTEHVLLVLLDSRHNRALVRAGEALIAPRFPIAGRRALELLAAGVDPADSAVVFL